MSTAWWSIPRSLGLCVARELDRIAELRGYRQRQRHRADLKCHPDLAAAARRRTALHRRGQIDAEWLRRELQRRLRDECLNEHLFTSLKEAREIIEEWRADYNTNRPHTSLNGLTPTEFAARPKEGQN
jgi:putative transposase